MARPQKQGIDYFPLDVDFLHDIKVRRVIRACGAEAVAVLIATLSLIYSDNGYYLEYSEDTPFLIADGIGIQEEEADAVIQKAVEVGLFDWEKFEQFSIITSRGIQSRFMAAAARRSDLKMIPEYIVDEVSVDNNSVNVNNNPIIADNNPAQAEFLHTKVHKEKKRKEKKSKEKERDARACACEDGVENAEEAGIENTITESDIENEELNPYNDENEIPITSPPVPTESRFKRCERLFLKLQEAYPEHRRYARDAQAAFVAVEPSDEEFSKMMKSLADWKECDDWNRDGGRYIPSIYRWIREERWKENVPGTIPPPMKSPPKNRTVIHRARPNAFEDSDQEVEIITRSRANYKDFFG